MSDFRDFIPANEDPGALGNGFTDFVPAPEKQIVEKPVEEVKEPTKEAPTKETISQPEPKEQKTGKGSK